MDAQIMVRVILVVVLVGAVLVAMRANDRGAKKCPNCGEKKPRLLEEKTEDIKVETITLPGVGGRTHVNSTQKYACQQCGHIWTHQVKT